MSTFSGPIEELPGVTVDNFESINYDSSCFFLSHCHTDHMRGLKSSLFTSIIKTNPEFFIYCSPISKLILSTFPELSELTNQIKELKIGLNTLLVPECQRNLVKYSITVSCIPAGHCPGSVMFLFQTPATTILYTGDFRIAVGDSKKFKHFYNGNRVIPIDTVYLDTTFFNECFWEFLSRDESIQIMIDRTREWLSEEPDRHVQIELPAFYGGEYIIERIAREFQCRVHVLPSVYEMYLHVPEMNGIFTTNCRETRIHAKNRHIIPDCLTHVHTSDILVLRPKAAPFSCEQNSKPDKTREDLPFVEVNYSSHSSFSEIVDFLNFLKPRKIYPCALAFGLTIEEQQDLINSVMSKWNAEAIIPQQDSKKRKKTTEKIKPTKLVIKSTNHGVPDDDLHSPK